MVELHSLKSTNTGDVITKAALRMRDDIKKQDVCQAWPPDIENGDNSIPKSVTHFIHTLMSGEHVFKSITESQATVHPLWQ